jgi:hypothetical protein
MSNRDQIAAKSPMILDEPATLGGTGLENLVCPLIEYRGQLPGCPLRPAQASKNNRIGNAVCRGFIVANFRGSDALRPSCKARVKQVQGFYRKR